ncbi:putative uncharacterized transposon-derived protein F52C9.6 [Blattella germanica]|nr:putative uncharacterized transposon-derived protein F52C9.6 [Blattella germanica]
MARTKRDLAKTLQNLQESTKEIGLQVNMEKTKMLIQTRRNNPNNNNTQQFDQIEINVVQDFTYLGTMINNNNNEIQEIKNRLSKANRVYFALLNIFKSKEIHRKTKIRLYKTIIRAVLVYGCET